jgi:hypothetical protein
MMTNSHLANPEYVANARSRPTEATGMPDERMCRSGAIVSTVVVPEVEATRRPDDPATARLPDGIDLLHDS